MIFKTKDYPVVFLSYDEENAETNYQRLLAICPKALRIDGVKGSDNAHKAIANLVKNHSHVIIVDADNFVNDNFLNQEIKLTENIDFNNSVVSFSGRNYVNGNTYGNGGVKCWPVSVLATMATHENSNDPNSIDFDLDSYLQLNRYVSDVHIEASPKQAWRSGFREGIKLCMEDGKLLRNVKDINWRNYERLWRWMHIGYDVDNGLWAIYGARQAAYIALTGQTYDLSSVRDFDQLDTVFEGQYDVFKNNEKALLIECNRLGTAIKAKTNDIKITDVYFPQNSKNYKDSIACSRRNPEKFIQFKYPGDYDIIFIDDGSEYSEKNYNILINRYPKAKILHDITDPHLAYLEAAKMCSTDYFWVVDSDAVIMEDFNFEFFVPFYEYPHVRVWHSKNIATNQLFEYGGVKLLPRFYTLHMNKENFDIKTSITDIYESIIGLSNYTHK